MLRKVVLILAIVVAASPSVAVAKAKHHPAKVQAAATTDPNANTGHLFHDLIWGKK